tara:strand:- start:2317 stop:2634 length:318 start_codon:yes stop_codon:yes gene_type:complete
LNKEEIVIDFTSASSLNEEIFMTQLSAQFQRLMNVLMTGTYYPVKIKGSSTQIDRFIRAISAEKDFAVAYNKYGLNNPATYKSKYRLQGAVNRFEKDTGLVWPFK